MESVSSVLTAVFVSKQWSVAVLVESLFGSCKCCVTVLFVGWCALEYVAPVGWIETVGWINTVSHSMAVYHSTQHDVNRLVWKLQSYWISSLQVSIIVQEFWIKYSIFIMAVTSTLLGLENSAAIDFHCTRELIFVVHALTQGCCYFCRGTTFVSEHVNMIIIYVSYFMARISLCK
jgi:hypothetical protein